MTVDVCAVGIGMTSFSGHHRDKSLGDLIVEAVLAAAVDAGCRIEAVNMVVAGYESDHFAGQMSAEILWNDLIGMSGKPVVRVEGGGASGALAIQDGYSRIVAGLADSVLVVGGEINGKSVSTDTAQRILGLSADTVWETPLIGSFASLYALSIADHMRRYGTSREQFAQVAVKNRRNALANPQAHKGMDISIEDVIESRPISEPYHLLDCSLLSDGAAAIILSTGEWAERNASTWGELPPVKLVGIGSASDHPRVADRSPGRLAHFSAKRVASRRAYEMAGIENPLTEIDVAEVYDSFSGAEIQAYEDLGFCMPGEGGPAATDGRFDLGGELPVNTSGGLLGRGSAVGATGIAQTVEIVGQLRGTISESRAVGGAIRGLTDTHAGVASLVAVNVYERAA